MKRIAAGAITLAIVLTLASVSHFRRLDNEAVPEKPKPVVSNLAPAPIPTPEAAPSPSPTPAPNPLGSLKTFRPRVTFRRNKELIWAEAFQALPLFAFDALKTDTAASATISLVNGSELELGEECLVILNPNALNVGLRRDQATVRAGKLKGRTSNELWLLTSAALMRLRSKEPNKTAKALLSIREGRKLKVELQEGEGKLLSRQNKGPKRNKVVAIVPHQPIVLDAPVVQEVTEWAEEDFKLVEAVRVERPVRKPAALPKEANLFIDSPANYTELTQEFVEINGRSTSSEAQVMINGQPVKVDANLKFKTRQPLKMGVNTFLIQLVREGREAVFRRWVVVRKE